MTIDEWLKADRPWNIILHGDCMELMQHLEDKSINLACVDPPYGLGSVNFISSHTNRIHKHKNWNNTVPNETYFTELYRISINQIIWGCNYFYPYIKDPGRIVHYKRITPYCRNGKPTSECDLASQSFNRIIDYFEYQWCGNVQNGKINWKNGGPDMRIHPTQKPIALYQWCLKKYGKQGAKILDTHSGSGSCAIACFLEHHDFLAIEKDADYHAASVKRFEEIKAQGRLF